MDEHKDFADGLRQVADFLESHPEIKLPEGTMSCYGLYNKAEAGKVAAALASGGRADKKWADTILTISRTFGPITLAYIGLRSSICEQVRVGTRTVPEQYVPPRPAQEGQIVPEHEEAIYEWRCAPLLGKPDIEVPEGAAELTGSEPLQLEAEHADLPF